MKNALFKTTIVTSFGALLAGCCSTSPPDAAVPIEAGLLQVGRGLASIKLGELQILTNEVFARTVYGTNKDFSVGLFPTDFSYVFNVTRSKGDSNTLYIEADAAVPQSPVSGKLGDSYTSTSSSGRANQIIINFASPFFTTTTTTTTNKQTTGSNTVTTVETKVVRSITEPQKISDFFKAVRGADVGVSFTAQAPQ